MKKITICVFIIMAIILVGLIAKDTTIPKVNAEGDRLVYIDYQTVDDLRIYRFYDKNTKVIYMFVKNSVYQQGAAGGLTVMIDHNGDPLLYK